MTGLFWDQRVADDEMAADETAASPALVSLRFLQSELRRRWRVWVALSVIGGLLGLLSFVALGRSATATTTLLLAHDPGTDPTRAMQTDLGLVRTRVLAEEVIADLGLDVAPVDLLEEVRAAGQTSQLLTISTTAPDGQQAVAIASGFARAYLSFRSEVLTQQAESRIEGTLAQAQVLAERVTEITKQIDALAGGATSAQATHLNDLIAERAGLNSQISQLRQSAQSDRIQLSAVVDASQIIDPAVVEPKGVKRRAAMSMASGILAGFFLGVGLVLGRALLSDRLRRRDDISRAVGTPVILSVGRVSGGWRSSRQARERVTARLLDELEVDPPVSRRWALLGVNSERDTVVAAADLIRALSARGALVTGVDLTETGALASALGVQAGRPEDWAPSSPSGGDPEAEVSTRPAGPQVIRPIRVPSVARRPTGLLDPLDLLTLPGEGTETSVEGYTVVVSEVTPAIGAEHLASWADLAVLVLAAGAASGERLRAAAYAVRTSGLTLTGVVLTRSDPTDDSLGEPMPDRDWMGVGRTGLGAR